MWSIHTSKCWRGLGGGGGIGGPRQPAVTITRGSGWHTGAILVLLHTAQLPYICLTPTIHTSLMVAQPNDILVHGGQLYSGNLWGMPLLCCWFVGSCKLYFTNWLHYNSTALHVHCPMANPHFIMVAAMNVMISPDSHSWIGSAIGFHTATGKVDN